jgi:hypothetical protein
MRDVFEKGSLNMKSRRSLPEDPIAAWLKMVARRQGPSMAPWLSFSAVVGLALLPATLLTVELANRVVENWLRGGTANPIFVPLTWKALRDCLGAGAVASIFLTLLVGPMVHAGLTARFLTSIRKARALEEVVATPLTPRLVLDALANHGIQQALRTLALPLIFCSGLFWLSEWPLENLLWAFLPATWAIYWFYSFLAVKAWGGETPHSERGVVLPLFRMVAFLAPAMATAWLGARVAWFLGAAPGAALVVLTSALWALVHREMAVAGLHPDSGLRRSLREWSTAASRPSHYFQAEPLNALVFREQASSSGTLHQRFLAHCLWMLPTLTLLGIVGVGFEKTVGVLAMAWPLAGLLAVLLVLQFSSARLYEERQQGSLDLLFQTGLTVQEFVKGCVGVAAGRGRRMLYPFLLATVVVLLPAQTGKEWPGLSMAWVALTAFLSVEAAAAWGTSMAADYRHRPQPAGVVVTFLAAAGIGWGLLALAIVIPIVLIKVMLIPEGFLLPAHDELLEGLFLTALPAGLLLVRQVALLSAHNTLLQKGRRIGFVDRLPESTGRSEKNCWTGLEVVPCASGPLSGGPR